MSEGTRSVKCYTFDPEEIVGDAKSYRRAKGYSAQTIKQKCGYPQYKFRYDEFIEFEDFGEFALNLEQAFGEQTDVKITINGETPCELAYRKHGTCESCDFNSLCDRMESFMAAWKIDLKLSEILRCPHCGNTISLIRETPPVFTEIHDVRLAGHPSRLNIFKNKQWKCDNCEQTVSMARIPGIQYVERSEVTLRLLSSVFELSVAGVPSGFIAEGYDLNQGTTSELCRKFAANTKERFLERVTEVMSKMPGGYFRDEIVYVGEKEYRAIFDTEGGKFYTILPPEDVLAAMQCLSEDGVDRIVKKSGRKAAALYAFSWIEPLRRQVSASLFEVIQASLVESRSKAPDEDVPAVTKEWLRAIARSDHVDLEELYDYLSDKENFRAYNLKDLKGTYLRATMKAAQKTASLVREIIDNMMSQWERETLSANNNYRVSRFFEFERSFNNRKESGTRLSVVNAMERASATSDYSVSEQLSRIQFYNEPSLVPAQENAKYKFPIMDEETGMPWLDYSQIGNGIPVRCLEHLLQTGLLQENAGMTRCISYRLKGGTGGCTLECCPFLTKEN